MESTETQAGPSTQRFTTLVSYASDSESQLSPTASAADTTPAPATPAPATPALATPTLAASNWASTPAPQNLLAAMAEH